MSKNSTTPQPKRKVRRPRQARQFEPSPIRDMDDFNQMERRQAEIVKQLESDDSDVLWA